MKKAVIAGSDGRKGRTPRQSQSIPHGVQNLARASSGEIVVVGPATFRVEVSDDGKRCYKLVATTAGSIFDAAQAVGEQILEKHLFTTTLPSNVRNRQAVELLHDHLRASGYGVAPQT